MRLSRQAKAAHLRLGIRGEKEARRILAHQGLEILTCNYSCKHGEIDIVAREGQVLCFVEVKTRHRMVNARPADAVGRVKRERIIKTAKRYLREIGMPSIRYRYDIMEIIIENRKLTYAKYWRNAFNEDKHAAWEIFPSILPEPAKPDTHEENWTDPDNWQFFDLR